MCDSLSAKFDHLEAFEMCRLYGVKDIFLSNSHYQDAKKRMSCQRFIKI